MQTNRNNPSSSTEVREYVKNRHAVWTTIPKGSAVNNREVVLKGSDQQGSAMEIARLVALKCAPWVTRVQVIKWEKDQYIAWLNIKKDEIYEFVTQFNTRKCVKSAKAYVKRGLDNDKKLVVHGVEGKTEKEITELVGADKVQQIVLTNNTAFVTMKSQTYAQVVAGDQSLNMKVTKYMEHKEESHMVVNKKIENTKRQLILMMETLNRRVAKLELELKKYAKVDMGQTEVQRKTKRRTKKVPREAASNLTSQPNGADTTNEDQNNVSSNWESVLLANDGENMHDEVETSPQRGRSKSTSALTSRSAFHELAELCLINDQNTPVKSNGKRCSTTQMDELNQKKRQMINTPARLPTIRSREASASVPRSDSNLC